MPKYRKKPVIIHAIQWTGYNTIKIQTFMEDNLPELVDDTLIIHTLEGDHTAIMGDFIIRGVKGEYYPCKSDIFRLTYDLVEG